MPVVKRTVGRHATNQDLKDRLVAEWRNQGSTDPRPNIVEETDTEGVVVHVYVVWSEWGNLDQQARSELITEAYWEVYDEAGLALTVAMGLTLEEAQRMGVSTS